MTERAALRLETEEREEIGDDIVAEATEATVDADDRSLAFAQVQIARLRRLGVEKELGAAVAEAPRGVRRVGGVRKRRLVGSCALRRRWARDSARRRGAAGGEPGATTKAASERAVAATCDVAGAAADALAGGRAERAPEEAHLEPAVGAARQGHVVGVARSRCGSAPRGGRARRARSRARGRGSRRADRGASRRWWLRRWRRLGTPRANIFGSASVATRSSSQPCCRAIPRMLSMRAMECSGSLLRDGDAAASRLVADGQGNREDPC